LTTKFTRHTAALRYRPTHCHPERSMIFREAENHTKSRDPVLALSLATTRRFNLMGLYPALPIRIPKPMLRNPSLLSGKLFQALIKIYVRLVIAQSIQLSNIVLVDLRRLSRVCSYGSYSLQKVLIKTFARFLKFLQPNVRCQISLTPNIGLRLRSVSVSGSRAVHPIPVRASRSHLAGDSVPASAAHRQEHPDPQESVDQSVEGADSSSSRRPLAPEQIPLCLTEGSPPASASPCCAFAYRGLCSFSLQRLWWS